MIKIFKEYQNENKKQTLLQLKDNNTIIISSLTQEAKIPSIN